MGFFDLNIPYTDSILPIKANSTSSKSTRIKIVIKAMELGYSGIAYNRTIKGVMSDRDRCSIPLLTLSSLLNLSPFLSSSVNFHRDLLGVPQSSPFRQYTRLTVCIDTASQSQALNSGNPVLKTYDIVAVRPLNQNAFDHACQQAQVDIISIDFSDKMPFRLKLPMVKAAIKRGVYFEVTYSDLIVDVHQRRQVISNAKLLLDWTRGRNIIFSSAAPSVCEVRGPNDVANLASLLGLSMERAKAAISKNCRSLLTHALRRKHFFKEVIRVEAVSSSQQSDSETPLHADWLKWDPISSGEGDLLLDDMAKSFASSNVSKTMKAIDFDSIIDKMPSHGFQVKDVISGTEASFQPKKVKSFASTPEPIQLSATTNRVSENSIKLDLRPEMDDASLDDTCSKHLTSVFGDSQILDLACNATKTSTGSEEVITNTVPPEEELETYHASDVGFTSVETGNQNQGLQPEKCYEQNVVLLNENGSNCQNAVIPNENVISHQASAMDIELDEVALEISPPSENDSLLPTQDEECNSSKASDVDSGAETVRPDDVAVDMDTEHEEKSPSSLNTVSLLEKISEKAEDDAVIADKNSHQQSDDEMRFKNGFLLTNHGNQVLVMEEQKLTEGGGKMKDLASVLSNESMHQNVIEREPTTVLQDPFLESDKNTEAKGIPSTIPNEIQEVPLEMKRNADDDSKTNDLTLGQRLSGKSRRRPRNTRQAPLFPLRRNLYPVSFKRKAALKIRAQSTW